MMQGAGRRDELSEVERKVLSRYLPAVTRDRPRVGVDDGRVLNGIVWKIRARAACQDVPARHGSWQSICTRFRRWALDGTFARMLAGFQADADAAGDIDWLVSVDSTIVRAHQHAAGAKGDGANRTNHKITSSVDLEVDWPPRFTSPATAPVGPERSCSPGATSTTAPASPTSWPSTVSSGRDLADLRSAWTMSSRQGLQLEGHPR